MARIVVAGKMHPAGEALIGALRDAGNDVAYVPSPDAAAYVAEMPGAEALVVRTQAVTAEIIAAAPDLRVVSRHGVGYDSVDLDALNARGIALAIVGDVISASVAEHAMMLLLAGAKRATAADRAVRAPGGWGWRNGLAAREVAGKTLLILGYGRIGRRLARMATGFDMEVIAHDPFLARSGWPGGPAENAPELRDALGRADFVSVHIPAGGSAALGPAEIAAMKPGVVLVNTARGGVIDEAALAEALASGLVAFAGLDVFGEEPPAQEHPLLRSGATLLSPHVAGMTDEAAERMAVAAIRNAVDYLSGTLDPALIVNRVALGR